MRTAVKRIEEEDANLVLVGNGNAEQGREFLEETKTNMMLLVDPSLDGYRAASLQRRLLAPYNPTGWIAGIGAFLRGYKPGRVAGDSYQLGGTFVVTPEQKVAYSFVNRNIYARAPIADVLAALRRLTADAA